MFDPAFYAGFTFCIFVSYLRQLFFCLSGIECRFLLPVLLHEPFPCCLSSRCVLPFPRTSLHDLLPFVPPEVVPVLPQFPSQAFYRYDQYCFHNSSFFASDVIGHVILLCSVLGGILISRCSNDFFRRLQCSVRATSVSAFFSMLIVSDVIRLISKPFPSHSHSHLVRIAYVPVV